jgi:exodeoxyribonuclease VII large subunit
MEPLTVSGLNAALHELLGLHFSAVSVRGELGQLQVASSGHAYLTLRDNKGSLSAICWRTNWASLRYRPKAGEQVICRGRIGVYSPQGRYQLYVTHIEPAGEGALAKELAARKARLEAEGLLDPRRKRSLPAFPKVIGVCTSLSGAALQDFLKVSRHRYPAARILVAGCLVQGREAAAEIVRAVELLVEDGRAELIVLTRGGGAKTDLLAFQDEHLARTIAHVPVPVLSAVGHEVDTTLCDLVADVVAATPSDAALLALPDAVTLAQQVDERLSDLAAAALRLLEERRLRLSNCRARMRHPGERLAQVRTRAEQRSERLQLAMANELGATQMLTAALSGRLTPSMARHLERKRERISAAEGRLGALSPYAVLERGYAIVTGAEGVIQRANQVVSGQELAVRVHEGDFKVQVLEST